jgi:hypothetical protein
VFVRASRRCGQSFGALLRDYRTHMDRRAAADPRTGIAPSPEEWLESRGLLLVGDDALLDAAFQSLCERGIARLFGVTMPA